jgi:hypothetical protein
MRSVFILVQNHFGEVPSNFLINAFSSIDNRYDNLIMTVITAQFEDPFHHLFLGCDELFLRLLVVGVVLKVHKLVDEVYLLSLLCLQ